MEWPAVSVAGGVMWGPKVTFGVSTVVVSIDLGKGCLGGEPEERGLWGSGGGVVEREHLDHLAKKCAGRGSMRQANLEGTDP